MKILLKRTEKEPLIAVRRNGLLEISGKKWIIDSDTTIEYNTIISEIKIIAAEEKIKNAMVMIEYFNTSASKIMVDILKNLDLIQDSKIHWFCEEDDETMIEVGEDLKRILKSEIRIQTC